ncbi:carbon-nitrogen family hydrolase [Geobacter pelophilus]|uniref:Carbon-nitrogen family hydrolase n=1 Tax=Geoanaerobacter pelophilus TaxID=60036 RepID=A0AAW4L1S6_9BACT|nr:carbon-nitrogen family hydrolase [Geoanaerobacter pelophilus]MBT0665029.1 carbon-nitrogen family hydrolase [Geoanaerobacter pelophilus]
MSGTIRAAAIQINIQLGDIDANVTRVREAVAAVAGQGVQLAVLPEVWSSGFAYRELTELAQRTPELVEEMGRLSAEYNMVLVGSLPEPDGDKVCNTAYLMDKGQLVGKYRKIHLFSLMNEDRSFTGGDRWLVADTSVGRIGVFICYDLRFPELARRLALEGAEIIVVPGEWPKPREEHWRTLLRARAIENQLFVVAANCCGMTGKLDFFGMSMIIDPKGVVMAEGGYEPAAIIADLDFEDMYKWREQIPCFRDRKPQCY